eukprot:CAMPEP_0196587704 /NCGR_PEP_ID=MMETSP1081-20130531/58348_1 /TAXON_ID=36882 /ORGANISM="Pyramimonas amylifera, Strain CCMP720" /LENGTH=245 /DNA_ID=CAMNT_0041909963 /DNA_START=49 /DNA_END=786 /DNA_ORIENTATION=-
MTSKFVLCTFVHSPLVGRLNISQQRYKQVTKQKTLNIKKISAKKIDNFISYTKCNKNVIERGYNGIYTLSSNEQIRGGRLISYAGPLDWLKGLSDGGEKFARMDVDEERGVLGGDIVGEPALLLTGFKASEIIDVRAMLKELGADFVKVLLADEGMMTGSLQQALQADQQDASLATPAEGVPRIMFLSGLSSGEIVQVMDELRQTGLAMPACAAVVPNSLPKPIRQLAAEIQGDHENAQKSQGAL